MFDFKYKKHNFIYNNLVKLSRNIYFYKYIKLEDKLENRIILIFAHLVIILICLKKKQVNKDLSQEIYDNIYVTYRENKELVKNRYKYSICFRAISNIIYIPYKILVLIIFMFPAICFFMTIAGSICK